MKAIVPALMMLALVAGCARQSATESNASPGLDSKAACENAGGKWKPLTHHCDRE